MLKWARWYNSFIVNRKESRQSPLLDSMVDTAKSKYNNTIQQYEQQWSLSRYRWRFDSKTCQLHFAHKKGELPQLVADAQILGSLFHQTQLWEGAWNTAHVPKKSTKSARQLRRFGRQEGQVPFYTGRLEIKSQKYDPLYLAAIALLVSNADFVYKGASEQQDVFFLLTNIRLSINAPKV